MRARRSAHGAARSRKKDESMISVVNEKSREMGRKGEEKPRD